jgi:hypothetical protein
VPDLTGELEQNGRRNKSWRRIGARGLIGMSAIGATAAVVLTAAASGAPATAGTHPLGHRNGLTETTSSSAGNMTIKATYTTGPRGRIKLGAVSYVGDSSKSIKKPVLLFTLGPAFPVAVTRRAPAPGEEQFKVRNIRVPAFFFVLRLKPGELKDFSGTLPARFLRSVNRHGGLLGGETLTVSLARGQFSRVKVHSGHKSVSVFFQPAMQAGMILNPRF